MQTELSSCAPAGADVGPALGKLSVLMPIYNERWTLRLIIARVLQSPIPIDLELVAVDDCSTDGSWELLCELAGEDPRIRAIRQPRNGGKGTAIRTAIAHMTGDVAVVQDADLEYDPAEYPRLLAPLLAGQADAVFGSRYAGATRQVRFFWHTAVNRFLTLASNLCTGLDLTDMETCYKMVRADVLRSLSLRSHTFTLEPELTSRLAQWGARIFEVPISYQGRSFREGKKIRPIDGLKALGELLRCRFVNRRYTVDAGLAEQKALDRNARWQRRLQGIVGDFIGDHVLEAKAGIGSLSWFFGDCRRAVLVEQDPLWASILAQRFSPRENRRIELGSLANRLDCRRWREDCFDTVLLSDWQAESLANREPLAAAVAILAPLGHLIWILPAAAGGGRSYEPPREAVDALAAAGLQVVQARLLRHWVRGGGPLWVLVGKKPLAGQRALAA
ncbi:MAG: glycosyltransferase [Planctomycetaceae bacterium]|nr:glycosyltransferase [Planctomycetaceae bacterium]